MQVMATLDVNDPLIRSMIEKNHVPIESWDIDRNLRGVICTTCRHNWPCPSRKSLAERQVECQIEEHAGVERVSMPISEWRDIINTITFLEGRLPELKKDIREMRERMSRTNI
jgi:hypothetical protein